MKRASLSLVIAASLITRGLYGADAPEWLLSAAKASLPSYGAKVPAVVLVNEGRLVVDERGRVTESLRWAVRVLKRDGRDSAVARVSYLTDGDKVQELSGWLIRPAGAVKRFGKSEILDVALVNNDVYNEHRLKLINAEAEAEEGAVFGYESVLESRALFNEAEWFFQGALPTLRSRYEVSLPPGWRAQGWTFNHPTVEPAVSGSTFAWELRDLPYLEDEPARPSYTGLAPWLAVSYVPPASVAVNARSFTSWQDVSKWAKALHDPQAQLTEALSAKARELTQGAAEPLAKVRAIARFVQGLPYISIQIGLGRLQPHPAAQVLEKAYGDCKDKANLMSALLGAVGMTSYPVWVHAGDPSFVRREWPSQGQFNHVILAIQVPPGASAPSIVSHPTLGRLLLFDPTEEDTLVGDLPEGEQGGLALVLAGTPGDLLTVPKIPPAANALEREASASLSGSGAISARVHEVSTGQAAARARSLWRSQPRADYQMIIERWLARTVTGVKASRVEAADGADGRFTLDVELESSAYGQLMQGRLLIFKPALVARRDSVFLTEPLRQHPVVLHPRADNETARIQLPAGFAVDELPTPVKLETSFGSYTAGCTVEAGVLVYRRSLTTLAVTVPVEQYASVRSFYERIMAAEQAPVVLVRQ